MQNRRRPGLAAARPVLVAIPVRDEAEEIGPCLLMLAGAARGPHRCRHALPEQLPLAALLDEMHALFEGRAHGGIADTMRRRIEQPDPFLDVLLEPAADALRRARLRRSLREDWSMPGRDGVRKAAGRLGLSPKLVTTEHFGVAWAAVAAASPVLHHRARVPLEALPAQTARALHIRDGLRREADRVGTALRVAAE